MKNWFCSIVVFVSFATVICGGEQSPKTTLLLHSIYQQFHELQSTSPLVVIVTSTQHCVGCAALAVNTTIQTLQHLHPTCQCVVVVATDDEREASSLREKFTTPFVLPGRQEIVSFLGKETQYPVLLVIDSSADVLYRQDDIQHHTLRYAEMRRYLGKTKAIQPDIPILLQEPENRSISGIISPLVSIPTMELFTINTLSNSIDEWDFQSGQFRSSFTVPDTLAYFYCTNREDWRWLQMKKQGYSLARFKSLALVADTLYALADVLAGYSSTKAMGETPVGTMDTLVHIDWHLKQVVVQIYHSTITAILPVPGTSSLVELVATNNALGGSCLWQGYSSTKTIEQQKDSLRLLQILNAAGYHQEVLFNDMEKICGSHEKEYLSIGRVCGASDGSVWYCDPVKSILLVMQRDGSKKCISPSATLRTCNGSIIIRGEASYDSSAYTMSRIVSGPGKVYIFLTPPVTQPDAPYLLQEYTNNGDFLGEKSLTFLRRKSLLFTDLVGADSHGIFFMVKSNDKHWYVQYHALSGD